MIMDTYPEEYFGRKVTFIGHTNDTDLVKIGDRLVRVSEEMLKRAKKWPKLYLVKFSPSPG